MYHHFIRLKNLAVLQFDPLSTVNINFPRSLQSPRDRSLDGISLGLKRLRGKLIALRELIVLKLRALLYVPRSVIKVSRELIRGKRKLASDFPKALPARFGSARRGKSLLRARFNSSGILAHPMTRGITFSSARIPTPGYPFAHRSFVRTLTGLLSDSILRRFSPFFFPVHSETPNGAGVTNAKLDNVTYERTIWLETSRVSSTDTNSRRFTTQPGGIVDATLGERRANESKKQTRSVLRVIEAINVLRFRCRIVRERAAD